MVAPDSILNHSQLSSTILNYSQPFPTILSIPGLLRFSPKRSRENDVIEKHPYIPENKGREEVFFSEPLHTAVPDNANGDQSHRKRNERPPPVEK